MSKPAAGNYIIYNRVLSPTGEKLAIAFNGQSQTVTVKPLDKSDAQIWIIADFKDGKTQSLSPKSATNLQIGWASPLLTVLPALDYVWYIRSSDAGYTIQDGGLATYWGVASATANANVTTTSSQGSPLLTQDWVLEKQ